MNESGSDIDSVTIGGIGLLGSILVAVAVILTQALFASFDRADAARKSTVPADLVDHQAKQRDKIGRYRWVDDKRGVVAIPIERAIDLTVERGLPAPSSFAPPKGPEG